MKRFIVCLLIAGVALAGCAKKEAVSSKEDQARQYLVEGTAFLKQGDLTQAIRSFAAAIKVAPDYFESYYMLGETLIRLKQFPQAASVMSAAVRQFPNNGLAYYLLAMAHEGSQQTVAAIVAARRSVELFNAAGDKEGTQRAMILLATFVSAAKAEAEKQMAENAAKDAANAVANTAPATVQPAQ
jgi:tetratricopeptide (TPR) repeat protein